ncbi:hypothetical protein OG432_22965 [Streptomyces sp. NBC_00442]|uniref:hypothetical protein n=1 Tax=Streptomyces sp. NBC_00442 TaxID=2903651 RepID=UPI002E213BF0
MRIDQVPADASGIVTPGASGGQKDLASTPAEKRAAAEAIERHIEPDTRTAGNWTDEQTAAVVKAFGAKDGHGWVTSSAVKAAHKQWDEQVSGLMKRLASEKAALRSTYTVLQGTDFGVLAQVRASSSLDAY